MLINTGHDIDADNENIKAIVQIRTLMTLIKQSDSPSVMIYESDCGNVCIRSCDAKIR